MKETVSDKLNYIRYTQIISDPFPEHSASNYLFRDKPPEVSIWAAYKQGYDNAYKEILMAIGHREFV